MIGKYQQETPQQHQAEGAENPLAQDHRRRRNQYEDLDWEDSLDQRWGLESTRVNSNGEDGGAGAALET